MFIGWMKILTITNKYPPNANGGAEIAAGLTVKILKELGHHVEVLTEIDDGKEKKTQPQPLQYRLGVLSKAVRKIRFHLNDCFGKSKLAIKSKNIQRLDPEVCHIHNLQGLGYRTFELIAALKIPTLITFHDYALTCLNLSKFHNGNRCEKQHLTCRLTSYAKIHYLKNFEIMGVCTPSIYLAKNVEEILGEHVKFIRQWNLPIQLLPLENYSRDRKYFTIGFIGRLDHSKGAHLLLDIIPNLPNKIQVKIAGRGCLEGCLRNALADKSNVEFLGFCTGSSLGNFYRSIDVLLVPSQWDEIYSLVVREAMSQGVPCMVSNRGALPEIVDNEVGWLISPTNTNDWIKAIRSAYDNLN